jgi:hypothetical protein
VRRFTPRGHAEQAQGGQERVQDAVAMRAIRLLEQRWHLRPGATLREIQRVAAIFGVTFPDDYVEIMIWSDGGDFELGEKYLRLWNIREVVERNCALDVQSNLPGTVAIGNDASDMLYLLGYREAGAEPKLLEVEGGAQFFDECTMQGVTFTAALHAWSGLDNVRRALLRCFSARLDQLTPHGGTLPEPHEEPSR